MSKQKIIVAKNAGFCFGVNRAVKMAEKELKRKKLVYCLGALIHNPQVVQDLEQKGFKVVKKATEVPEGQKVLIRSHGVTKEIIEELRKREAKIIDATCPFVKRAQLVAEKFAKEGLQVIIFGDPEHAEVVGIKSYAGKNALVVRDERDLKGMGAFSKIGLLSQTTHKKENFQKLASALLAHTDDLHIINTICSDTAIKQAEAKELAKKVDLMLVIGGKESSNTKKLFQLSKKGCEKAYHIEVADEIKPQWLEGVEEVGIAAGASTPEKSIRAVVKKIKESI
ncbi:MAG TPA: 4-hydroxy-3-methylbut-2-enyl diphosphate reductase [Candidatus Moranbacteria bacterium]|nr:4-hydroxy-3-methylbut-2-enyl diphosphate reductase [Candidatus Moranbacteria bacterium]